ncbi:hypothetical protein MMC22_001729 [Lobaria immixta]|nr:hypothetical protein [Lobaria immixta]
MVVEWGVEKEEKSFEISRLSKPSSSLRVQSPSAFLQRSIRLSLVSGDSYTSTQFDVHGEQPNPGNPLGNPAYPGVTSCDGPNYVDFLTTTYNRSYIQTFNFGFGGATVDPSLVPSPFGDIVQSFKQQVQQEFIPTYGDKVAVPWSPANSLVTLFFGINDMVLSHSQQNDSLNYALIKSYESIVHQLYDAGIRNFLIMNVPPLDRDPSSLAQTDSFRASLARYIGLFNFRLEYLALNLAANFPETTVFQLNTNQLFTLTLNNPKSFAETSGYTNTTGVCPVYQSGTPTLDFFDPSCGVPINEYLWMNNLHATYPMHNLMASQIVQLLGD